MPISSIPISVRSSVNLSDINIDTDLDMGSNSIIGYIPTTNINTYLKDLITEDDKKVFVLGTPTVITLSADLTEYSTYQSMAQTTRLTYTATAKRLIKFKTKADVRTSNGAFGQSTITTYFKNSIVNSQTGSSTKYETKSYTQSNLVSVDIGDKIEMKWNGNVYSGCTNYVKNVYIEVIEFAEIETNKIADTSFTF
jgi:hypothetical protein